jgi:hypothetical protein
MINDSSIKLFLKILFLLAKKKQNPKKLWRTLRVRHSFLGLKVFYAHLHLTDGE